MQGQIINTLITGNQGVILGDDGVQYSLFTRSQVLT